jgi:diguanylate cyclase (GGDEF)-like protein
MALSAGRRASLASAIVAAATFVVVIAFIFVAAHRPAVLSERADAVEWKFSQASTLQTLRLYIDHVREAQEELWIERSPSAARAYAQARDWFSTHLHTVASWNPGFARDAGTLYAQYVDDTERALHGDPRITPEVLTRDYSVLENYAYHQTMGVYDAAYALQDAYDAFRARNNVERGAFLVIVALVTLVLLGLSQYYRVLLQRVSEERIEMLSHAALNDALTGLRNLRAFEEDLPKGAAVAQRFNHPISLVLVDVDRFKEANDRSGHAAGDQVLKQIAARLKGLREADGAYRLGGDEFAVMLPGTSGAGAEVLARRLVAEPVRYKKATVTLSAGIAQLRVGEPLSDWRERADIALYESKRRGGETAVLFENIEAQTRFVSAHAVSRIRELISHEGMQTAFQPIWNREATEIVAFEALARPLREYRFSGPQEAFDAAHRSGRIMDLDLLCIRSALGAVRDYGVESPIFLNVTPATLEHPLFAAATIGALLAEYGVEAGRVVIEITERAIRDLDAVVRSANAVRQLGVRVALDDAGAGSSGMTLLSSLTFDYVKLDRTLLLEGHNPKARGVLAGILAIADSMGAVLIAEGIETPELLEFARNLHRIMGVQSQGVRALQGYLLGQPRILTASSMAEAAAGAWRAAGASPA